MAFAGFDAVAGPGRLRAGDAHHVSGSMSRPCRDAAPSLLRLLAAVIKGDDAAPPAPEDRQQFAHLAREHRVEQMAAWRILRRGGDLASWFGTVGADAESPICATAMRRLAVVDAIRTEELAAVLGAIATVEDARPLVFKGAALAHSHYPQAWLRPRLDSDILVSPARTAQVFDALERSGYARTPSTSGRLVVSQASFTRTDAFGLTHALDLHWKIANWHVIACASSHAELASRSLPLAQLGPSARAVSDADALLLACLHRAAHHRDSEELLWLYDIHLVAERLEERDWTVVIRASERGAVKAICARGLALVRDYFGSPIPARVMDAMADAHGERSSIYLSKKVRLVDGLVADLRMLPLRDCIRLLAEHACPPARYISQKYGLTSRGALLLFYARRLVTGVPRWFACGTRS
jgi:hypothetical protein